MVGLSSLTSLSIMCGGARCPAPEQRAVADLPLSVSRSHRTSCAAQCTAPVPASLERRSIRFDLRVATFCQISPLWPGGLTFQNKLASSKTSRASLDLESVAWARGPEPWVEREAFQ